MFKKRIVITLTIIAVVVTSIGFNRQLQDVLGGPQKSFAKFDEVRAQAHALKQIPEHVTYELLFRRIQFFLDKQMPDSRLSALLQDEYGINADQAEKLKQVARSCIEEVKLQDMRAQEIIAQVKARFPKGVVPRGQKAPPLPQELVDAQEARNGMILRARSGLQSFLGDDSFHRFDEKVKMRLKVAGLPQAPAQK